MPNASQVKNGSGAVTATIVVGEVLMFHVHEGVADSTPSGNTVVKIQPYRPVSRLGGNTYARVSRTFDLPRPDRWGPQTQCPSFSSIAMVAVGFVSSAAFADDV